MTAGLTDDGFLMDVDACIAHLGIEGFAPEQAGIVGFCMRGRVTFLVAARRRLGASVGFYGGGIVEAGRRSAPQCCRGGSPSVDAPVSSAISSRSRATPAGVVSFSGSASLDPGR